MPREATRYDSRSNELRIRTRRKTDENRRFLQGLFSCSYRGDCRGLTVTQGPLDSARVVVSVLIGDCRGLTVTQGPLDSARCCGFFRSSSFYNLPLYRSDNFFLIHTFIKTIFPLFFYIFSHFPLAFSSRLCYN